MAVTFGYDGLEIIPVNEKGYFAVSFRKYVQIIAYPPYNS